MDFLGSAGLGTHVDAARTTAQRREPVRRVIDHNRPVVRPLTAHGLDNVLALLCTTAEAISG